MIMRSTMSIDNEPVLVACLVIMTARIATGADADADRAAVLRAAGIPATHFVASDALIDLRGGARSCTAR